MINVARLWGLLKRKAIRQKKKKKAETLVL